MQFQKGQSGNPAGRPRGSRNKASMRMQELLEEKVDELVNKVVELATGGNIGALRLCLDRIVPTRKDEPLLCAMPPLGKAADAVAAIAGIASAAAAGEVTADEAAKLAKVISLYVNTLEAHEFEHRLAQLERADVKRIAQARNDTAVDNNAVPSGISRSADVNVGAGFKPAPTGAAEADP